MTLSERVAYLKGLAEGMKLSNEKDEGKLLYGILEAMEEMAASIGDLEDECDRLNDYCEELDEDLGETEEYVFGECDDECCCGDCCDDYDEDEDYDDEDYDDDVIEIECPKCGEIICVPPEMDYSRIICPACNEEFSYIEEDAGPADED